ncbi:MAG: PBP1A family penicillin-binding protein [Candidatus Roizmanbacteria bacterium]|nr:PBP1A family penicillin-binding protein [Candidatus Roizmanbacteria bacterium]
MANTRKVRGISFFAARTAALFLIALFILGGGIVLWAVNLDIPDLNNFQERDIVESTKIYDRTGKVVLYDVHGNVKRTIIPFIDISDYTKKATVAIEDARFYQHNGIDPQGIARALIVDIGSGQLLQGGSTITQQVMKNALLSQDKNVTRKIKEIILAIKLEKVMTKDEILSAYLNEEPFGGSIYGVEEASESFFGIPAKEVTLAQAAYLAALPKAPTYFSPYGQHRDKLEERKNLVLTKMAELKMISLEDAAVAKKEKVEFLQRTDGGIKAAHFVDFVRSYLEEKYGRDAIEQDGYRVITTIDWKMQAQAQEIVAQYAKENETKFNAGNAALVAIDPKTGQILTMVGSRDYFDRDNEGNFNVATASRQPGSAFKPFAYATAFMKGYTPDTVLFDVSTEFDTSCTPFGTPIRAGASCYHPENYDGIFRGPMSMRNALAQSVNIPSVKVMYLAGISNSIKTARSMGITTLTNSNQYGLSLALGGGEVSLLDMVSAYGVFANEGVRNPYSFILKVEDSTGKTLEEYTQHPERVIPEQTARQISDVLSDNSARAPAFGDSSYLYLPGYSVAVKTGTTNDYRDAWIVGYTPELAVGAWAGNNNNTPMEKKVAGFIIAPLWNAFMKEALPLFTNESFTPPTPTQPDSKPILRGMWQGNIHSILYFVDPNNPLGNPPLHPENDYQFNLWETPVLLWGLQHGGGVL